MIEGGQPGPALDRRCATRIDAVIDKRGCVHELVREVEPVGHRRALAEEDILAMCERPRSRERGDRPGTQIVVDANLAQIHPQLAFGGPADVVAGLTAGPADQI